MNTGTEGRPGRGIVVRGAHAERRTGVSSGEGEAVVVGEMALGRFRLLERIGAGGFGTVYRGRDERLERPVAVKVIDTDGSGRRPLREAHAAARLNHPGIVTVHELGEEDGRAYLVSELVEGRTLDELARDGALSDRDVAELGAELCDALAHAHAHGVVHRDIKPQNVIVRDRELPGPAGSARAKLMDFGTASLVGAPGLTATGEVIGTIAYMAPEQAEGLRAGPAADVYALALTLFECLSGRNPFSRATPAATARAIGEPVPPLSESRPDLPPDACGLIDACLGAEPERRPSLDELRDGLEEDAPWMSAEQPVPAPRRRGHRGWALSPPAAPVARIVTLSGLTALVAWLGLGAGRPGTALVVAALVLPVPLLLPAPAQWGLPPLAPLLGGVGLAPVYPALAAFAGTVARRALLAALGWAWLVAAEAILDSRLLFGTAEGAPGGWSESPGEAATAVLAPVLAPESLLMALVWTGGAVTLGAVIRGRVLALELLAVLLWAAGVVALHGALAGEAPDPAAGPLAAALVAIVVGAMWVRTARHAGTPPGAGRSAPLP
jgi:eukaryotic-like serine/threonine-protein kinase